MNSPSSHSRRIRKYTGQITKALSAGFLSVIGQLAGQQSNPVLQANALRIISWLNLVDTPKNSEQRLANALERTTFELHRTLTSEFSERVLGYLNEIQSNPAIPQLVAASVLEMTQDDAAIVPQYLLTQIRIQEVHYGYFGRFLYCLRQNLALEHDYSEVIAFANDLAGAGILEGFAGRIAASLDHIARIEAMLDFEFRSRRISDNRKSATRDYLRHLREHQLLYSPLPLVKAGVQGRTGARIKDIFVPLAIRSKEIEKKNRQSRDWRASEDLIANEGDYELGELIIGEQRLILLGPPGSGKTTLLKRIALALAEGRSEEIPGWKGVPGAIPIFLRLRSFAAYLQAQGSKYIEACPASIISYVEHYYREEQRITLTPDFFDKLLEEGGCGVFMDGLDEVPLSQRSEVAQHVEAFVNRYRRRSSASTKVDSILADERSGNRILENLFILTSRPKGHESVEVFLRSAQFAVREVKPMEPAGIRELINNLLSLIEPDSHQRLKDYKGLSDAIFRARDLTNLAGTPLFCTSLVLVYKYHGAELPERRIDVFEEIVDLLLGFWKAQDQKVVRLGRLDEDEGTGIIESDIGTAVKIKKKRLSYIALQMQLSEKRTEIDFFTLVNLLRDYLIERERTPPEKAGPQAEKFLITSHERSGLLVETEPSDPPIYAFTHEGFREYLVADALANLREHKFISSILDNIDNPTWEEVIVLAGAHSALSDDLREYLLERCVEAAGVCKSSNNSEGWARRLTMAGRMAKDMGDYLSPNDRSKLREILAEAMLDTDGEIKYRIEVALVLDHLGWLTDTLSVCVQVQFDDPRPPFYIGKNLVSNQQYERFMEAPDFGDPALWENPFCLNYAGDRYSLQEEAISWFSLNKNGKKFPKSWNDPKFGIAHRGLPVVGINWFEANAYCRWLHRHWKELDEGKVNPGLCPVNVRLPTTDEWGLAVFGVAKDARLPWHKIGDPPNRTDLLSYANIGKSLDRTSPIGMFSKGMSFPNGLVDVCGNAWEWQANYLDRRYRAMALCGGSFTTPAEYVFSGLKGWRDPSGRDDDLGFRILVEV